SALFQFDPGLFWFEEVDDELVLTADLDIPLIRYNIHDRGKVLSFAEMMSQIGHLEIQERRVQRLPFVVVSGRTDVAVVLYGAKIYPQALQMAMQDTRVRDRLSGSVAVYSTTSRSGQALYLDFELSAAAPFEDPELPDRIAAVVQEHLLQS